MGTEISLSIDRVDVCWSKNHMGIDHGSLFQSGDRKRFESDQVNYDCYESEDAPDLIKSEMGFAKPLRYVVPRLELMGITLDQVRLEYERAAVDSDAMRKDIEETEKASYCMPFDQFLEIAKLVDIGKLNGSHDGDGTDKKPSEYGANFIDADALKAIPLNEFHDAMVYSEQSLVSHILDFLSPYSALRLLAENESNLHQEVKWQYGPLVENGWADVSMFQPCARRKQKFLIITEGHTDVEIIKLAIKTLRPQIYDFFCFIDMTEGHPFGGTGNLQRFAKGLAQMDAHNKTLFLYDNDTEGLSAFRNTRRLNLPTNMKVAMLPSVGEFKSFQTIGPSGKRRIDINGKAVAIECYLDLYRPGMPEEPTIRWSGYKGDVKQYQGALMEKDKYTSDFLSNSPSQLLDDDYDLSKLQKVVDTIFQECVGIACSENS
ncbi:Uncharacterised protein [Halioglobus japonicus]|nr:Uncharacterised protein [Halioglobus japonicus]